jgi:hypothetical protein
MHPRPSFYREVHKGIRSLLSDLTLRAGQLDWSDAAVVDAYRRDVEAGFHLLSSHAHKENEFIAPLLEQAAPEVAKVLEGSHDDQETQLTDMLAQLRSIDPGAPHAAWEGHRFTLALSRFAGESLVHMADEEEVAMTAMQNAFDDAKLLDVNARLVASIRPDTMAAFLRWMLPAMTDEERAGLMRKVRNTAPVPAFASIRALAAAVLTPRQNAALEGALEEVQYA